MKPNWPAIMKPNRITSWLALEVWILCDEKIKMSNRVWIWLAPHVFGVMVGGKGRRIK